MSEVHTQPERDALSYEIRSAVTETLVRTLTVRKAYHKCGGPLKYQGHIDYPFPFKPGMSLLCWHECETCGAAITLPSVFPQESYFHEPLLATGFLKALKWCAENDGECLGDHPSMLREIRKAIAVLESDPPNPNPNPNHNKNPQSDGGKG